MLSGVRFVSYFLSGGRQFSKKLGHQLSAGVKAQKMVEVRSSFQCFQCIKENTVLLKLCQYAFVPTMSRVNPRTRLKIVLSPLTKSS